MFFVIYIKISMYVITLFDFPSMPHFCLFIVVLTYELFQYQFFIIDVDV